MILRILMAVFLLGVLDGCASSPLGRKQLILLPNSQMNEMGASTFEEMKRKQPIEHSVSLNEYVKCVAERVAGYASERGVKETWEVVVFRDPTANAFALPGGKIGVHTGLLPIANSPAQLAAVLGHEVGHVIARHGAERVSEGLAITLGSEVVSAASQSHPQHGYLMAALGLGAQFGVLLPHSRTQELEADLIGLELMAKAGFDPKESVQLWENMMKASQGSPPEFLSTHPSGTTRIEQLKREMGRALALYEESRNTQYERTCTQVRN